MSTGITHGWTIVADDMISVYLPKDLRGRLPELMRHYNVKSPSMAIRRAVEEALSRLASPMGEPKGTPQGESFVAPPPPKISPGMQALLRKLDSKDD